MQTPAFTKKTTILRGTFVARGHTDEVEKHKHQHYGVLQIKNRRVACCRWILLSSAGLCLVPSAGPSSAPVGCTFAARTHGRYSRPVTQCGAVLRLCRPYIHASEQRGAFSELLLQLCLLGRQPHHVQRLVHLLHSQSGFQLQTNERQSVRNKMRKAQSDMLKRDGTR